MNDNLLVCSKCGNSEVTVLAHVDANTNEYKDEGSDDSAYCDSCDRDTTLVTRKEFLSSSGFKQLSKKEWDEKTNDSIAYIETEMGFHIALDITYMDQVDEFEIKLPTGEVINTKFIE